MKIAKNTFGMGDRFAHQGKAQLAAVQTANDKGLPIAPVWNKSNREHEIVGSRPDELRAEADAAVAALGWKGEYYVDADHINLKTVDAFLQGSNFFTLDVADSVGVAPEGPDLEAFLEKQRKWLGVLSIPGIGERIELSEADVRAAAGKFLAAIRSAGEIYRKIETEKGSGNFVTEVSIDETDSPQSPVELFLILAMIADEGIPVQTIAPKFTGRFNKGVDYVGDPAQFEKEFDQDLCVIAYAVREFGLPAGLKLSVHSGSDKFSIYPIINRLIRKHDAGLHVKTAGTTWLEEVIGLADAGDDGLKLAKAIYKGAYERMEKLTAPYATVIDVDAARLPDPSKVEGWSSAEFVDVLRHDPENPVYNQHFRQLIHVAFKVAAEMGTEYTDALKRHEEVIARNVTYNLLQRHILPIFASL
ncbi:MAG: tagaturonate epimerase family protein [Opitutales bacterium]